MSGEYMSNMYGLLNMQNRSSHHKTILCQAPFTSVRSEQARAQRKKVNMNLSRNCSEGGGEACRDIG